jgi:hypothetical protein
MPEDILSVPGVFYGKIVGLMAKARVPVWQWRAYYPWFF